MPAWRTAPAYAPPKPARPALTYRRRRGDLTASDFLNCVQAGVRERLPEALQTLQFRQQGSLLKFFADEPSVHYELWLHLSRRRVEVGLHFETRDAERNRCLLDYVADELPFLKEALGQGLEAEPWDKGWTRLYTSHALEGLCW